MYVNLVYSTGSSDLLSPIFSRKEKQEEVRKPMSLSERLRQEFGLDDTENDPESDNKPGECVKLKENTWHFRSRYSKLLAVCVIVSATSKLKYFLPFELAASA